MTDLPRLTVPLDKWLLSAAPGESVIYWTGITGAKGKPEAHKLARALAESGAIRIFQKRIAKGSPLFHHIAVRTTAASPSVTPEPRKIVAHRAPRATAEVMEDRMARIVAHIGEGMSLEDIAKRLGVSRPTVSRDVAQARKQGLIAQDQTDREAGE